MNVNTNVAEPQLTITLVGFDEIAIFKRIVEGTQSNGLTNNTIKEGSMRKQLRDGITKTGFK